MGRAGTRRLAERIAESIKERRRQRSGLISLILRVLKDEDIVHLLAYLKTRSGEQPDEGDPERGRIVAETLKDCLKDTYHVDSATLVNSRLYPDRQRQARIAYMMTHFDSMGVASFQTLLDLGAELTQEQIDSAIGRFKRIAAGGNDSYRRWLIKHGHLQPETDAERRLVPGWQEPKTEYQTWAEGARQTMAEKAQEVQKTQQAHQAREQQEPALAGAVKLVYQGYLADGSFSLTTIDGPVPVVRGNVYTVPAGVFAAIQEQEAENKRQAEYASKQLKRSLQPRRPDWKVVG